MERLILCGGGHVSLELAHIAQRLEFELVVVDDRAEFANTRRFPMASQVLCQPFLQALDSLGSRADDYYAILTRGHAFDKECLEHILRGRYAYVGMIGSRNKVAAVRQALEAEGISREILDGIYAPIGLKLGGQTPAEIAVSIAAQLVAERARLGPDAARPPEGPGVLCTIVEKHGSAPRGVGTWMLVRPDGSCVGTIGGGAVEYQARLDALSLWQAGVAGSQREYDLSHAAAELGMVCGGRVKVDFQLRKQ
ncbi:XdhC family protein [uncultured Flavonifractor sp.]|uniref:XdhC family protein n=1 Tax=uncultured Flavonifractor sp. TaxID=1193534 RepID=UPI0026254ADB|nr:XdhC/CoxI family protein [uncultured Flavonifractor sp.]